MLNNPQKKKKKALIILNTSPKKKIKLKKADAPTDDTSGAYVTATAVTTRTARTHEDLGKNAKTQQLEEKTVATTTTHNANRQEQRTVTQEVLTTATVTSGDQVTIFFCKRNIFFLFAVFLFLLFAHVKHFA